MSAYTSAGTQLYIADPGPLSPAPSWVEIGEVTNAGEFGRSFTLITHTPLASRDVRKYKGSRNDGAMVLEMARDPADLGQAKLITAVDSDFDYNFRIVLNDQPASPGTPSEFTFKAKVMGSPVTIGDTETITSRTVTLEIQTGTITEVAAT